MTQGRWIELRDTEQGKVMVDLSWLPVTGDKEVIRSEKIDSMMYVTEMMVDIQICLQSLRGGGQHQGSGPYLCGLR